MEWISLTLSINTNGGIDCKLDAYLMGIPVDLILDLEDGWLPNVRTASRPRPCIRTNTMAEQNVLRKPSYMNSEQIVTRLSVVNNREKQLLFNAQKIQKNPHLLIFSGHPEVIPTFSKHSLASASVPAYLPCNSTGRQLTNPDTPGCANAVGESSLQTIVDHAD
ncbi:hypothetical protein Tco_0748263 [Tanacetum coccineum]|uniref:Uncharacterized protein n=1 Tax=Tanacetum coccineum TaxID=301880 RepID=A0ABQ4YVY0_9ASTR